MWKVVGTLGRIDVSHLLSPHDRRPLTTRERQVFVDDAANESVAWFDPSYTVTDDDGKKTRLYAQLSFLPEAEPFALDILASLLIIEQGSRVGYKTFVTGQGIGMADRGYYFGPANKG